MKRELQSGVVSDVFDGLRLHIFNCFYRGRQRAVRAYEKLPSFKIGLLPILIP
ncbi:hypothetical protein COO91_06181 [Nostoc flagelliforme CCNUN1]|uniref:Transposase n=1 Tax=Nostoc flagelliforme CCNUN1 TaxID=2038116 RepID=A0A2K8SZJ1_9NOSO|nr:hypothetical protein COO91_06181 [Nostoc flagelliforme CCNUN1]